MLVNEDLTTRTLVHAARLDWIPTPVPGVERRMLFRIGGEKARATSIVRYAPGSSFSRHSHPGGEEFLVLEGTFQDESGDFPTGSYVRNPPGTAHAPRSELGCTIFVKLWQFGSEDRERVVCPPCGGKAAPLRPGVASSHVLFESQGERVTLEDWQPGAEIELPNRSGIELLVVAGELTEGSDTLERLSWLRIPASRPLRVHTGRAGARVWYKSASLLHRNVCDFQNGVEASQR